jgi:LysR family transcriptional regulator, transcriptional activator of nhaA
VPLNYTHLRAFRWVAREGGLTRAAERLNVAPSALSTQLRALEADLGQALFERRGRRMELTEAGRIALDHAETIFSTGEELWDTLKGRGGPQLQVLRLGAVATLSRNFQVSLLRRFWGRAGVRLVLRSGSFAELLAALDSLALDAVLSNAPAPAEAQGERVSARIAEQKVSLVGPPALGALRFPEGLRGRPLLLPGRESSLRERFERLMDEAGIAPVVAAEVDDMALLRLLARESGIVALVPPIVVQDELAAGVLAELAEVPALAERFYAITRRRRFPNPLLAELLGAASGGVLPG